MIQIGFKKITIKLLGYLKDNWVSNKLKLAKYLKENWGSPFIVGSIVLLLTAALSLSDNVAVYAYYALVVGVFLQLASFLKYHGKNVGEVSV